MSPGVDAAAVGPEHPAAPLRERLLRWRDARLASPSFRQWALRFPLTRPIARRRARALFDLVAGFVYSQVLLALVQLRLLDRLAEGPQPLAELARLGGLDESAAQRLLEAAVALRLAERRGGGRYGLGVLGAPLAGDAGLRALIEHHAALYADLRDPVALLRGEPPSRHLARYWPYAGAPGAPAPDCAAVAAYSRLMAASLPALAAQILDAYPVGRHRCVLDVGGGEGAFLAHVAHAAPRAQLRLFDLPAVAARAHARFAALGLGARAQAIGGDFRRDPLPGGADLITLVRVVHDHDEPAVRQLLRAARAALPEGGALLLAEPMADTAGAEPMGAAYFGFYLLAMGSGRPRSAAELCALLHEAGFRRVRALRTALPLHTGLLLAHA
jgi:demethylspheroidene O-methyltransferase